MSLVEEDVAVGAKDHVHFFQTLAIVFVSLLAIVLAIVWLVVIPKLENCLFSERMVCLQGRKYEKYNWRGDLTAQAYHLKKPLRIEVPFDGWFVYSLFGFVNYQGENMGHTPVLSFRQDDGRKINFYVEEVNLLIGQAAEEQRVQKGVTIAEVLPGKIDFLDNYSLVQVNLPPNE